MTHFCLLLAHFYWVRKVNWNIVPGWKQRWGRTFFTFCRFTAGSSEWCGDLFILFFLAPDIKLMASDWWRGFKKCAVSEPTLINLTDEKRSIKTREIKTISFLFFYFSYFSMYPKYPEEYSSWRFYTVFVLVVAGRRLVGFNFLQQSEWIK